MAALNSEVETLISEIPPPSPKIAVLNSVITVLNFKTKIPVLDSKLSVLIFEIPEINS